jgi:hypothetical protein
MAIVPTVGSTAYPRAEGFDGYIGNILVRLAVSEETPIETVTADAVAQRVDTSDAAEDIRDEVGSRYSRSNLSGGAGMDFLHSPRRPDDSPIRYWDSRGVDVFDTDRGESYAATLLHEVKLEEADSGIVRAAQIDGTIYYISGTSLIEAGVGTKATLGSAGIDLVALGNSLYVLETDGTVDRYDPPTWTPVSISTGAVETFTRIWAAKGRVLGVEDNILYEADTTSTARITLSPNDTVTDVTDAGAAVLVLTTDGTIHSLVLDDSYVLVEGEQTPFVNEIPVLATNAFGFLGIASSEASQAGTGRVARFYTAQVNPTGAVTDLQLIYQVGDRDTTDDLTPTAMAATRDSIFTSIPDEGLETATVWRYYLPTAGYARSYEIDMTTQHEVASLISADNRIWAAVLSEGLWMEQDTYIPYGYIIGPLADFFTAESKQWVQGEVTGEASSSTEVVLLDSNDEDLLTDPTSSSWRFITRIVNTTTDSTQSVDMVSKAGRYHVAKVELRSDPAGTYTPAWWSYSFRAMPSPERDQLMRIPINVSDQIESPGTRAIRVPRRGDDLRNALMAYEGVDTLIELWRPPRKIQGTVEKFEEPITTIPKRGSVGYVMYARVRGRQLSLASYSSAPTIGSSLGQDTLGLTTLGVGDPT